jgi:divalent metal cation (Fe/Co/Zn/Cd) transporter
VPRIRSTAKIYVSQSSVITSNNSPLRLKRLTTRALLLIGVTASVEMQQHITYICLTHSPDIQSIDTVRCYHSGPRLIAEVDVVMNPKATLKATHDVAEEL